MRDAFKKSFALILTGLLALGAWPLDALAQAQHAPPLLPPEIIFLRQCGVSKPNDPLETYLTDGHKVKPLGQLLYARFMRINPSFRGDLRDQLAPRLDSLRANGPDSSDFDKKAEQVLNAFRERFPQDVKSDVGQEAQADILMATATGERVSSKGLFRAESLLNRDDIKIFNGKDKDPIMHVSRNAGLWSSKEIADEQRQMQKLYPDEHVVVTGQYYPEMFNYPLRKWRQGLADQREQLGREQAQFMAELLGEQHSTDQYKDPGLLEDLRTKAAHEVHDRRGIKAESVLEYADRVFEERHQDLLRAWKAVAEYQALLDRLNKDWKTKDWKKELKVINDQQLKDVLESQLKVQKTLLLMDNSRQKFVLDGAMKKLEPGSAEHQAMRVNFEIWSESLAKRGLVPPDQKKFERQAEAKMVGLKTQFDRLQTERQTLLNAGPAAPWNAIFSSVQAGQRGFMETLGRSTLFMEIPDLAAKTAQQADSGRGWDAIKNADGLATRILQTIWGSSWLMPKEISWDLHGLKPKKEGWDSVQIGGLRISGPLHGFRPDYAKNMEAIEHQNSELTAVLHALSRGETKNEDRAVNLLIKMNKGAPATGTDGPLAVGVPGAWRAEASLQMARDRVQSVAETNKWLETFGNAATAAVILGVGGRPLGALARFISGADQSWGLKWAAARLGELEAKVAKSAARSGLTLFQRLAGMPSFKRGVLLLLQRMAIGAHNALDNFEAHMENLDVDDIKLANARSSLPVIRDMARSESAVMRLAGELGVPLLRDGAASRFSMARYFAGMPFRVFNAFQKQVLSLGVAGMIFGTQGLLTHEIGILSQRCLAPGETRLGGFVSRSYSPFQGNHEGSFNPIGMVFYGSGKTVWSLFHADVKGALRQLGEMRGELWRQLHETDAGEAFWKNFEGGIWWMGAWHTDSWARGNKWWWVEPPHPLMGYFHFNLASAWDGTRAGTFMGAFRQGLFRGTWTLASSNFNTIKLGALSNMFKKKLLQRAALLRWAMTPLDVADHLLKFVVINDVVVKPLARAIAWGNAHELIIPHKLNFYFGSLDISGHQTIGKAATVLGSALAFYALAKHNVFWTGVGTGAALSGLMMQNMPQNQDFSLWTGPRVSVFIPDWRESPFVPSFISRHLPSEHALFSIGGAWNEDEHLATRLSAEDRRRELTQLKGGRDLEFERRVGTTEAAGKMWGASPWWFFILPQAGAHEIRNAQNARRAVEIIEQYRQAGRIAEVYRGAAGLEVPALKPLRQPLIIRIFSGNIVRIFGIERHEFFLTTTATERQALKEILVEMMNGHAVGRLHRDLAELQGVPAHDLNPLDLAGLIEDTERPDLRGRNLGGRAMRSGASLAADPKYNRVIFDETNLLTVLQELLLESLHRNPERALRILRAEGGSTVEEGLVTLRAQDAVRFALLVGEARFGLRLSGELKTAVDELSRDERESNLGGAAQAEAFRRAALQARRNSRSLDEILRDGQGRRPDGWLLRQMQDWYESNGVWEGERLHYLELLRRLRERLGIDEDGAGSFRLGDQDKAVLRELFNYLTENREARFNSFNRIGRVQQQALRIIGALRRQYTGNAAVQNLLSELEQEMAAWLTRRGGDLEAPATVARHEDFQTPAERLVCEQFRYMINRMTHLLEHAPGLDDGQRTDLQHAVDDIGASPWVLRSHAGRPFMEWRPIQVNALVRGLGQFALQASDAGLDPVVRFFLQLETGAGKSLILLEGFEPLVRAYAKAEGREIFIPTVQAVLDAQLRADFTALRKAGSTVHFGLFEDLKSKMLEAKLKGQNLLDRYWILADEMDGAMLQAALSRGQAVGTITRLSSAAVALRRSQERLNAVVTSVAEHGALRRVGNMPGWALPLRWLLTELGARRFGPVARAQSLLNSQRAALSQVGGREAVRRAGAEAESQVAQLGRSGRFGVERGVADRIERIRQTIENLERSLRTTSDSARRAIMEAKLKGARRNLDSLEERRAQLELTQEQTSRASRLRDTARGMENSAAQRAGVAERIRNLHETIRNLEQAVANAPDPAHQAALEAELQAARQKLTRLETQQTQLAAGDAQQSRAAQRRAEAEIRRQLDDYGALIIREMMKRAPGWEARARRLMEMRDRLARAFAGGDSALYTDYRQADEHAGAFASQIHPGDAGDGGNNARVADNFLRYVDGKRWLEGLIGVARTQGPLRAAALLAARSNPLKIPVLLFRVFTGRESGISVSETGRARLFAARLLRDAWQDRMMASQERADLLINALASVMFHRGFFGLGTSFARNEMVQMFLGHLDEPDGFRYDSVTGRVHVVMNGQWHDFMSNPTLRHWQLRFGTDLILPYSHRGVTTIVDMTKEMEARLISLSGSRGKKVGQHFDQHKIPTLNQPSRLPSQEGFVLVDPRMQAPQAILDALRADHGGSLPDVPVPLEIARFSGNPQARAWLEQRAQENPVPAFDVAPARGRHEIFQSVGQALQQQRAAHGNHGLTFLVLPNTRTLRIMRNYLLRQGLVTPDEIVQVFSDTEYLRKNRPGARVDDQMNLQALNCGQARVFLLDASFGRGLDMNFRGDLDQGGHFDGYTDFDMRVLGAERMSPQQMLQSMGRIGLGRVRAGAHRRFALPLDISQAAHYREFRAMLSGEPFFRRLFSNPNFLVSEGGALDGTSLSAWRAADHYLRDRAAHGAPNAAQELLDYERVVWQNLSKQRQPTVESQQLRAAGVHIDGDHYLGHPFYPGIGRIEAAARGQ